MGNLDYLANSNWVKASPKGKKLSPCFLKAELTVSPMASERSLLDTTVSVYSGM